MDTEVMGDISKLPKWAQDHIASLNREIQTFKEGPVQDPTLIGVGYHGTRNGEPKFWIRSKEHVTFYLEPPVENRLRRFIAVRFIEGSSRLLVHASDELRIMPRSSNSLELSL